MAKITTITNPLTGQPAQVDQLDHTAQEIDDAIARALPGGAIDITLQNKAPAGYGYGEKIYCYNFTANFSEFTSKLDTILSGMTNDETKQILIYDGSLSYSQTMCTARILCNVGGDEAILTTDFDIRSQAMVYRKQNGIWQPPEYVNPPMELDKEYRTTERWHGKPVYVRTKEISALAIGSSSSPARTDIENFTDACDKIVRYEMYVTPASGGAKFPIPFIEATTGVLKASGSLNEGQYLYGSIYSFDDLSGYKANVTCWYTKTTD